MSHICKNFQKAIKTLKQHNFDVIKTNHGYKIIYKPNGEIHSFHPNNHNKGYHPLRRWVNCVCGIRILL